jgi:hypothetical protein
MSLVHYVRPFLELGICKEYSMARKTTESTTTTKRTKKTAVAAPPVTMQVAPELQKEVKKEARKSGKPATAAPVNLEEAIRHRAYELYLERRATAGAHYGDPNQDWLIAEREIRSRQGGQEHTA